MSPGAPLDRNIQDVRTVTLKTQGSSVTFQIP